MAKRILITGAEGLIGSVLRMRLGERYEIVALTRTAQNFPSMVADIANLGELTRAFAGVDAVIHLAAAAWLEAPWEEVLPNSIVGTRNVFEAARQCGVKSVVFASSGHVLGMAEDEAAPAIYALDDSRIFGADAPVRPNSEYAVAKVFGEAMGRYYAEVHGLRVICLRIGNVLASDDPTSNETGRGRTKSLGPGERFARLRAKWLSQRDCAELFACALDAEQVGWAVVFGTSNNPRQIWSLEEARRLLGFVPKDSAPAKPTA
jgi:NAD+ dependent glucose-6-phosphate dehydrogenase